MKKFSILSIAGLIFALVLVSGCGTILVTKNGGSGTGSFEERPYDLEDFTEIEIDSTFHFTIEQSDTYSVVVKADSSMFDDITVEKSGQKLIVSTDFLGINWGVINIGSYPRVTILMPVLRELTCSGSTDGTMTGFTGAEFLGIKMSGASDLEMRSIAVPDIDIKVDGSSDVKVDLQSTDVRISLSGASNVDGSVDTEQLDIGISGSSDIDLVGTTRSLDIVGSGASGLELDGLNAADASVILSGASDCELMVTDNLDAVLSGASSLEYSGEPDLGNIDITSSSDLKQR